MVAFGVDLAESASKTPSARSFVEGLPYVIMVVIVALTSYYQQKQIQGRNPNAEMPPQQKMLMRLFPAMFVVIAFVSPSALVVYFVTSNLYRIGMQAYITRTLYHGEDSLGAQAQRASAEAKKLKEEEGGPGLLPAARQAAAERRQPDGDAPRRSRSDADARAGATVRRQPRPSRRPRPPAPRRPPEPVQEEEAAEVGRWSGSRRPARRSKKPRTRRWTSSASTSRTPSSRWSRSPAPGCSAAPGARRGCGRGCGPPSLARRSSAATGGAARAEPADRRTTAAARAASGRPGRPRPPRPRPATAVRRGAGDRRPAATADADRRRPTAPSTPTGPGGAGGQRRRRRGGRGRGRDGRGHTITTTTSRRPGT